jgi:hypothetical protein
MIKYFFDIPVYRLPEKRYYAERDADTDRKMYPRDDPLSEMKRNFYQRDRELRLTALELYRREYGGIWRYNEIIGFIRLHFMGSQIRGEYFCIDAKRIVRTRRKIFEWRTHKLAPEVSVPPEAASEQIFDLVKEYLGRCKRELRKRHIDTAILDTLGPYIDWKRLYTDRLQYGAVA